VKRKKKVKQTCLAKYGVEYASSSKEIQEKIKQNCLIKYGVESTNQLPSVKLKKEQTLLRKYGKQFHELSKRNKYYYDNTYFDSSWELAYYYYLKTNKINFIYHPKTFFEYLDAAGKSRKYFPDFLVENQLVEIKGDYFFKDGKLMNPYTTNIIEELKTKNKYKCMIENNIKILIHKDLKDIIKFSSKALGGFKKFKV